MIQAVLERRKRQAPPPQKRRLRSFLFGLLEFSVCLIVGLLLLDPLLGLLGVENEESMEPDPICGWRLMPGKKYTYGNEGFSVSTINSHGMRDRERAVAKPPNTYRIAVVGCSLTEGNQVFVGETFCSVLENMLNSAQPERKFEVLNFAVSAYTLGQEYLALKHKALVFEPDLVIFTARPNSLLYMGPDPKRGFHNARPVYRLGFDGGLIEDRYYQDAWLKSKEARRMESTYWLRYNSRLWGVVSKSVMCVDELRRATRRFAVRLKNSTFRFENGVLQAELGPEWGGNKSSSSDEQARRTATEYMGKVAALIIKEAKTYCERQNCRFVFAYLPAPSRHRDSIEKEIFANIAAEQNLSYIDCNPVCDAVEESGKADLYIRVHPSAKGHKVIAELLKSYLLSQDLIK